MPCRLDLLKSVRVAAGISQNELAMASTQDLATIVRTEEGATLEDHQAAMIVAALGSTLELCGQAAL